ncbi:hypothetical protein M569_16150, partial [Genlisea aurea]
MTGDMRVSDLIIPRRGCWNKSKVREVFAPIDAEAILSIPLAKTESEDKLIWNYSLDGIYSVKSGYHLQKSLTLQAPSSASSSHAMTHDLWKSLWKLPLPPKIVLFGWRLAKNILPLKHELGRRKLLDEAVWKLGSVPWQKLYILTDNTFEWLDYCFRELSVEQVEEILITLWFLWWNRNANRYEGTSIDPMKTHRAIEVFIVSCADISARRTIATPLITPQLRWAPPSTGMVKLNFDSGHIKPQGTVFGGLIRDCRGRCLAWFAMRVSYWLDPEHCELLAARSVLELAKSLDYFRIVLEGDCIRVINALKQRSAQDFAPLGNIYRDVW